jgi:hypothetical protein
MAAFFEVGFDVMRRDPARDNRLDRLVLVTNAADDSVREGLARDVVSQRLKPLSDSYQQFEFPRTLRYAHDLIDPNGLNGKNIDAIYGALYPYLGIEAPAN